MPYLDDVLNPYQSLTGDLTAVDTLSATLTNEGELTGYIAISDIAPVSLALNDLTDVEITEPENNEVLTYNSELGKWENKPAQGGGGSSDYTDLTNKPQINSITLVGNLSSSDLGLFSGDYDDLTNKPTLATVATTGDYDDLTNKPTIPAAQVNADWDAVSGVAAILNKPALATVATSGDYDDLIDKPTIPTNLHQLSDVHYDPEEMFNDDILIWVNGGWYASTQSYQLLANKPEINGHTLTGNMTTSDLGLFSGDYDDLTNKPTLATVATSGSYADLTNKPTIPDELTDLSDTNITSPSDGQILKYDGNTSKWVNGAGGYDYSTTEHVVGKWTDGVTDVYEITVNLPATVSCSAGNTSAAGAWTHLYNWTPDITIIDFKAWNIGTTGKTYWGHLSAQWSSSNSDIRALNIRSSAANVDGFTMRYIRNV